MGSKRLEANRKLVKTLSELVENYPDWRFGQILFNAGYVDRKRNSLDILDPFYEESKDTLTRVMSRVNTEEED